MNQIQAGEVYWAGSRAPRLVRAIQKSIKYPDIWFCRDIQTQEAVAVKASDFLDIPESDTVADPKV